MGFGRPTRAKRVACGRLRTSLRLLANPEPGKSLLSLSHQTPKSLRAPSPGGASAVPSAPSCRAARGWSGTVGAGPLESVLSASPSPLTLLHARGSSCGCCGASCVPPRPFAPRTGWVGLEPCTQQSSPPWRERTAAGPTRRAGGAEQARAAGAATCRAQPLLHRWHTPSVRSGSQGPTSGEGKSSQSPVMGLVLS